MPGMLTSSANRSRSSSLGLNQLHRLAAHLRQAPHATRPGPASSRAAPHVAWLPYFPQCANDSSDSPARPPATRYNGPWYADGAGPRRVSAIGEGHALAVLGQNHRIGLRRSWNGAASVRIGSPAWGSAPPARYAASRIQRQRQIQRVNAGGFQRNAHLVLVLAQPVNKRLMTAGAVGKLTPSHTLIQLDQSHRQRTGAYIDAAKCCCWEIKTDLFIDHLPG
jgi:hypothetical protein